MFATNPSYFQGYPQSQAPATSGMNASQSQTPDHSQLGMPAPPSAMVSGFPPDYNLAKTKRKQVRNACINCQKACKKCDEQRPCPRCVKYGSTDTCVNSVRKERKKGVKRGPYKKRKQGGATSGDSSASSTPNMSVPQIPNGMYSAPPATSASIAAAAAAAASRGPNAPITYQPYGNTAQFESFPNFQGNAQYLPYNILNNMNNIIQQAAANANAASKDSQQEGGANTTTTTATTTTTTMATATTAAGETKSETDENGKLSILSQLCTAVLDRAPNGGESGDKDEKMTDKKDDETNKDGTQAVKSTPQSATHSRESTKDGSATATDEPMDAKTNGNATSDATATTDKA